MSHSTSKITDEELRRGVVCRIVRWGKGKKKIFLLKIFMPKIFLLKIFLPKIFTPKIFLPELLSPEPFSLKTFLSKIFPNKYILIKNIIVKNIFEKIFLKKIFPKVSSQNAAPYKHHISYGKSFKKFSGGVVVCLIIVSLQVL